MKSNLGGGVGADVEDGIVRASHRCTVRIVAALLYLPSSYLGGLACFVTSHIELQCDEQRNKIRFVPRGAA